MEKRQLQVQNHLQNKERKLATLTNNDVMDVLIFSKISKPNNFESLSSDEWKWLCGEIKKDFGDKLTQGDLMEIITNGIKGVYDKTQFALNGFTIYRWIRIFLSQRPKVSIPCPQGIEPFYWNQMVEREQKHWLENKQSKTTQINDSTPDTDKASKNDR